MKAAWPVIPVVALLNACDVFDPPACTLNVVPGIALTVVDSVTGDPVVSEDLTATATEGIYFETYQSTEQPGVYPIPLAGERPGTYTVVVTAPDYQRWERNGVRVVQQDECHVRTTALTARLQPESAP